MPRIAPLILAMLCLGSATAEHRVGMRGVAFAPAELRIKAGDTVTFVNDDDRDHRVTSTDDGPLDSGNLSPGKQWSFTFSKPGTYRYGCSYHPRMRGVVVAE
jgi:plastocyanin